MNVIAGNISNHGMIYNIDNIIETIKRKARRNLTDDLINEVFQNTTVYYYTEQAVDENDYDTKEYDNKIYKFKLVVLNNQNFLFSKEMCLSFRALYENEHITWKGCLFGSVPLIFKKCMYEKNTEEKTYDGYSDYEFYNFLYSNLFLKEKWKKENEKNCFERLYYYLTNMCAIIKNYYEKDNSLYRESIVENTKYILFDSRLLDKYGNKIYLIHKVVMRISDNKENLNFISPIYVANNECLRNYGFNFEDIYKIKSVKLYNNTNELIFDGDINEIDLEDTHHLKHILQERRDRLPENLRSLPSVQIYMYLKMSIEYAVKMSKLDYKFIVPSYSLTNNEVQFLIPFYEEIGRSKPTCAIVISKKNTDKWALKTILLADAAYNNARLLSVPSADWLI